MPELKRALVESLAEHWNTLDAHVKEKFEAAAVLARIWTPRTVVADKPSERIAGNDVAITLIPSIDVTFELGKHDIEADLRAQLTRAAEALAASEDKMGVDALLAKLVATESTYEDAEARLREAGVNERLAVLVSPKERARLAGENKGNKSRLQYLEELLDVDPPHFQTTRAITGANQDQQAAEADAKKGIKPTAAITGANQGQQAAEADAKEGIKPTAAITGANQGQQAAAGAVGLVTSKDPAPLVIVRAGAPQIRVKSVDGNIIILQLVIGLAVARTLTSSVVAVRHKT